MNFKMRFRIVLKKKVNYTGLPLAFIFSTTALAACILACTSATALLAVVILFCMSTMAVFESLSWLSISFNALINGLSGAASLTLMPKFCLNASAVAFRKPSMFFSSVSPFPACYN